MKIAVISMIRDPWGGSEELWYAMAKEALAAGHQVAHLRFERPVTAPKIKELEGLGLQAFTRPGYIRPGSGQISRQFQIGVNFLRKQWQNPFQQILEWKPDIVLYNGTCYSIAGEKGLLEKVRSNNIAFFILGQQNTETIREISDNEAAQISDAYAYAKKVMFVSSRNMHTAERHLATRIINAMVVRNPVNLTNLSQIPFPTPEPTVHFALVGRLYVRQKGQDVLLNAFASKQWRDRNWVLHIFGDGPDKNYLERLVAFYGLERKVVFEGNVPNIRKVWEQCHMLLMPSIMEGMPLAVVEAMLCGRPCLATDVGGSAEWVEHQKNGFIAAACSVNALQATLEEAWQAKSLWADLGASAAHTAQKLYDPNPGKSLLQILVGSNGA